MERLVHDHDIRERIEVSRDERNIKLYVEPAQMLPLAVHTVYNKPTFHHPSPLSE